MAKNKTKKTIKVTVDTGKTLPISYLNPLQGDLKSITDEAKNKLKASILKHGFSFPIFVWENPEDGVIYILDGHQRKIVMDEFHEKGYIIPQLPVVFTEGKDLDEAKKKLLAVASQYGQFNQHGTELFLGTIKNINLDFLRENVEMPFVNFNMMDLFANQTVVSEHLRKKTNPNEEWDGMPEFDQEDKTAFRSIIVHFESQENIDSFEKLLGQNITDKTKSLWYPKQINMNTEDKRYTLKKKK